MNKRFAIILAVIIVGFVGLVFINKKEAKAPDGNSFSVIEKLPVKSRRL